MGVRKLRLLASTIALVVGIVCSARKITAVSVAEMETVGLDPDQLSVSLEKPDNQKLLRGNPLGEKRGWQNLHGSWGKRDSPPEDYDLNPLVPISAIEESPEYDDNNPVKYAILVCNGPAPTGANEQKRGWKAMGTAWGKRINNADWNRFRGSWGKREPGWNNLKGLWGKRSSDWNKLQSAWGKRDSNQAKSYY